MSEIADLRRMLLRELDSFKQEINLFPDDDLLWVAPGGVTNSVGNLALHVAGNLRHFVGAVLGGTGYTRNRDAEFNTRGLDRAAVLWELDAAIAEVASTLGAFDSARMDQPYPLPVGGITVSTRRFLIHLATHLAWHLGQAGYLRRILTGQNVSTAAVPVPALAEP
jgi:uncharacterized damage-inducible protein DinB